MRQVTKVQNRSNVFFSGNPDFKEKSAEPAVVLTKHIALEAASALAYKNESELLEYFHPDIIKNAKNFKSGISIVKEKDILSGAVSAVMLPLGDGGLLAALWDISEMLKMGMEIDMKAVPVKQETIEICEYYSLNPYELPSGGSLMIVTTEERRVCRLLESEGIDVKTIGVLNHSNDRILFHNGVRSFLNRPSGLSIQEI